MTYRCLNLTPAGGLNLGIPKKPLLMPNFGITEDQARSSVMIKNKIFGWGGIEGLTGLAPSND